MKLFEACPPRVWTPPLSEDFVTDGDKLIKFVELAWRTPESLDGRVHLEQWQKDLIRCVLERYPDDHPDPELRGRLRYRQVVVSIPRQHGKSLIGAIMVLYGMLMHERGPYVVGTASSAEQAAVVYDRVLFTILNNPDLKKRFSKMTETRGIRSRDGSGKYEMKSSSSRALQGLPVSFGMFDELHIAKKEMWQAYVNGSISREDGIIFGITTAGDDKSDLLKDLYGFGEKAAAGDPRYERFGFFEWSAPDGRLPEDEEELKAYILASNPAVASGRLKMGNVLLDLRTQHPSDGIRYRLNRFVTASSSLLSVAQWSVCEVRERPELKNPVFCLDQSPGVTAATITASGILEDGRVYTEVVASIVRPTTEKLLQVCIELSRYQGSFVVDSYSLKGLAEELKRRGYQVTQASSADVISASANFYHKTVTKQIAHPGDPLMTVQLPHATRKNVGENWRIARSHSGYDIDTVMATAVGVYFAQNQVKRSVQLFV